MANIFNQSLSKHDIMKRVGNIGAFAGINRLEYQNGRANGLRAYEVHNEAMRFTVYIDKCMDIGTLHHGGIPMYFLARPGQMNNLWYNDGENAPRSITAGMMFTCGLNNVGPIQQLDNGRTLPQHGYIRNSPATTDGACCYWDGDEYILEVYGEIREASLFGENLVVRRTITTRLGDSSIHIHDEIENEGCEPTPLMLMYHCNAGFPMLDANSYLEIDAAETTPRDDVALKGMKEESFSVFGKPVDSYSEQVFYHRLNSKNGVCCATLVNPDLKKALEFSYDEKELPYLIQWKCKASGDYVTGIEPSNCHPEGFLKEQQGKSLRVLQAGEKVHTSLSISIISDEAFEKRFKG